MGSQSVSLQSQVHNTHYKIKFWAQPFWVEPSDGWSLIHQFKRKAHSTIEESQKIPTGHSHPGSQDSYPLWIRQISVVNSPWLFQKLYEWIRPWLNTEVKEMLVFHQNYEELHKFVEKSILPEDYGGQTGPLDNAEVSKALQDMEGYFQDLKKYVRQCN